MNIRAITLSLFPLLLSGITMSADEKADDIMSLNLEEVVVTGSNRAVSRDLTPYTVSVIDRRQLETTGDTRVLSAVSGQVPSLFVTERGLIGFGVSNGGAGHIKLRGVGGDRASGSADDGRRTAAVCRHILPIMWPTSTTPNAWNVSRCCVAPAQCSTVQTPWPESST